MSGRGLRLDTKIALRSEQSSILSGTLCSESINLLNDKDSKTECVLRETDNKRESVSTGLEATNTRLVIWPVYDLPTVEPEKNSNCRSVK